MSESTINARYLYFSHGLSAFGDRSWQFAIPLLLLLAWGDKESLVAPALYQLSVYCSLFLLLPWFGSLAAHMDRLKTIRLATFGQNICTVITSGSLLLLHAIRRNGQSQTFSAEVVCIFVLLVGSSIMAEVGGETARIALERDWVPALFTDGGNAHLTQVNTTMRRIDLLCKLSSPLLLGIALQYFGGLAALPDRTADDAKVLGGTALLIGYNLVSILPQYLLARAVYRQNQVLHTRQQTQVPEPGRPSVSCGAWGSYFRHLVFLPSFAYATLNLTVLSNGTLMTAYLQNEGLPEGVLGLGRGAGAAAGLLGTIAYAPLKRLLGDSMVHTGSVAIGTFWALLLPLAVLQSVNVTSAVKEYTLVFGVVVSRFALWCFDLSHTEIMQVLVAKDDRTRINMCESATIQVYLIVLSVCGVVFSSPAQFIHLVQVSVSAVGLAMLIYLSWACGYRKREHQGLSAPLLAGEQEPDAESVTDA